MFAGIVWCFDLGCAVYLVVWVLSGFGCLSCFNFLKLVLVSSALCRCFGLISYGWVLGIWLSCFVGSLLGLVLGLFVWVARLVWFD